MSALAGEGFVAIWHDVAPEGRADYYEWHNREHMPERANVPGFIRGRRYLAEKGSPEYFNLYEVETVGVLTSAAYLERRYGWAYGAPAYAAAVFVGYSRVHAKEHWTTDVVAGAALGITSNLIFTRRYHKMRLAPTIAPAGGVGVSALVEW